MPHTSPVVLLYGVEEGACGLDAVNAEEGRRGRWVALDEMEGVGIGVEYSFDFMDAKDAGEGYEGVFVESMLLLPNISFEGEDGLGA
jgi:hypothetical protein